MLTPINMRCYDWHDKALAGKMAGLLKYREQFEDNPGTSRIGCCINGRQANDTATNKAVPAGTSALPVKCPGLIRMSLMLSALTGKNIFVVH